MLGRTVCVCGLRGVVVASRMLPGNVGYLEHLVLIEGRAVWASEHDVVIR